MRSDEIRELTVDDIKARVAELEEERFRLRFRSASEPLENPLRLRTIRKNIARLKTILTERERGAGNGEKGKGKGSAVRRTARANRKGKRVKNG
jgi:large subunit ribosomal protein L29